MYQISVLVLHLQSILSFSSKYWFAKNNWKTTSSVTFFLKLLNHSSNVDSIYSLIVFLNCHHCYVWYSICWSGVFSEHINKSFKQLLIECILENVAIVEMNDFQDYIKSFLETSSNEIIFNMFEMYCIICLIYSNLVNLSLVGTFFQLDISVIVLYILWFWNNWTGEPVNNSLFSSSIISFLRLNVSNNIFSKSLSTFFTELNHSFSNHFVQTSWILGSEVENVSSYHFSFSIIHKIIWYGTISLEGLFLFSIVSLTRFIILQFPILSTKRFFKIIMYYI